MRLTKGCAYKAICIYTDTCTTVGSDSVVPVIAGKNLIIITVFARSDAAATIYFIMQFCAASI